MKLLSLPFKYKLIQLTFQEEWKMLHFRFGVGGPPRPVPELPFLPAPYRGWTRAGERRVQDNLHAHAQNEPIKNCQVPTTLLASMCRTMPFSARALKENIFFDVDIVIKNIKT